MRHALRLKVDLAMFFDFAGSGTTLHERASRNGEKNSQRLFYDVSEIDESAGVTLGGLGRGDIMSVHMRDLRKLNFMKCTR